MVPPPVTTSARSTVHHDKRHSGYEPYDLPDEDDFRQDAAPERPNKKVIILLDMDCYEAQVWIKEKRPDLETLDVPVVVVNFDKIILAVNYTAKALGITRGMERRHLEQMEQKYPKLILLQTGELFGKQDCITPQKRSDEIFQVLLDFQKSLEDPNLITIERFSKDEVYIDVTNLVRLRTKPAGLKQALQSPPRSAVDQLTLSTKTHPNVNYNGKPTVVMEGRTEKIYGSKLNFRILEVYPKGLAAYHADETGLAHGAVIAFELVKLIKEHTGFDASAGVAHNKLLAKLASNQNKPQGITIFTDISIPRMSKKLKFTDIPGYGGKKGENLLTYFSERSQEVRTLSDVLTCPFDALVAALKAIGLSDEETEATDLLKKCQGQDESVVSLRHFADTINASINFRGTRCVTTWDDFKDRVLNLSEDVAHRIKYNTERWKRSPRSLVVKATMRKGSNTKPSGLQSRTEINGSVYAHGIDWFIMHYIKANNFEFREIEDIKVTAADFQESTEDDVANEPAAKDHVTQSAAEGYGPGTSKSETMTISFKGDGLKTHTELRRQIGMFSEKIATKLECLFMMQHKSPRELIFNATLFDVGGAKVQSTKEHRLVIAVFVPEPVCIKWHIMGYIEANHLEAPQIEEVVVTLKGIKKIGSHPSMMVHRSESPEETDEEEDCRLSPSEIESIKSLNQFWSRS